MNKNIITKVLGNPFFFVSCIAGGLCMGLYCRWAAHLLEPIAKLYTNLLQVTVIPIILVTILTGISKLMKSSSSNSYMLRIVKVFSSMLVFTGVFAALVGSIAQPGKNMSSDPSVIKIVRASGEEQIREVTLDEPLEKTKQISMVNFLINTVPNNIFNALSNANMLQIIVFCIIFSLACGFVSREDKKNRLASFVDYIAVLHKINEKVLLFLPLGSFCLLSTQLSSISESTLETIFKLALVMLSAIVTLSILCSVILWSCSSGITYFQTLKSLANTLLMAFSTQSSLVCIPRAVDAMSGPLKFEKQTVELAIPLGVPLCQFSTVCFYVIGSIFVMNIFGEPITLYSYVFITFASILTSFAASGAKGIVYYSLIAGILAPLGIPLGGAVALFIAVDPLVDPFGTVFHVYATCCSSAICCKLTEKQRLKEEAKLRKGDAEKAKIAPTEEGAEAAHSSENSSAIAHPKYECTSAGKETKKDSAKATNEKENHKITKRKSGKNGADKTPGKDA
ncbi:MAG: dicarboxylate/amino acid:cation symporter [Holosporales bacterium]|jgi:proton glutamate symport protein|nr:dicarboxylate/amino acid:cation symporter [Holosporales bacterium]